MMYEESWIMMYEESWIRVHEESCIRMYEESWIIFHQDFHLRLSLASPPLAYLCLPRTCSQKVHKRFTKG